MKRRHLGLFFPFYICLTILFGMYGIVVWSYQITHEVAEKYLADIKVSVYFTAGADSAQISSLVSTIKSRPDVLEVRKVSPKVGADLFGGGSDTLISSNMILPFAADIYFSPSASPAYIQNMLTEIHKSPLVEDIVFDANAHTQLKSNLVLIDQIIFILGSVFVLTIFLLLYQLLRLTYNQIHTTHQGKHPGKDRSLRRWDLISSGLSLGLFSLASAVLLIAVIHYQLGHSWMPGFGFTLTPLHLIKWMTIPSIIIIILSSLAASTRIITVKLAEIT